MNVTAKNADSHFWNVDMNAGFNAMDPNFQVS